MNRNILIGFVVLLLVACSAAPEQMTAAQIRTADTVSFMRPYELSRTDVSYTSLGTVRGESCQSQIWSGEASQEEALMRLKLMAAERQANRVVLKRCEQDEQAGCHQRWWCEGEAYQEQPLQ